MTEKNIRQNYYAVGVDDTKTNHSTVKNCVTGDVGRRACGVRQNTHHEEQTTFEIHMKKHWLFPRISLQTRHIAKTTPIGWGKILRGQSAGKTF